MPLSKLWLLAYRDLGRNRRRSILTLVAVALGLALLFMINGLIAGVMEDSLQNTIRLRTGHLQIRSANYEEGQASLQAKDLLDSPAALAARAQALPEVKAVAPVVLAGGVLNAPNDTVRLEIMGIDTTSPFYTPIQSSLVSGEWLATDDRSGILIGRRLANSLGVDVGQRVNLLLINSNGQPDQDNFTIRGLFSTGIPTYDESAVLMPISKAQAFTGIGDRASAVVVLLNQQEDAAQVAAALQSPGLGIRTWQDLNEVFLQAMQAGRGFYVVMDLIVMLIVAVIITNTLLMSVFERVREMGILAALGMKGRHIMQMFLLEAATLSLGGIAVGVVLGLASVAYLVNVGIPITAGAASVAGSAFALGTTMYGRYDPPTFMALTIATLIVVLLASLYPAFYASRLEPIKALHEQ